MPLLGRKVMSSRGVRTDGRNDALSSVAAASESGRGIAFWPLVEVVRGTLVSRRLTPGNGPFGLLPEGPRGHILGASKADVRVPGPKESGLPSCGHKPTRPLSTLRGDGPWPRNMTKRGE